MHTSVEKHSLRITESCGTLADTFGSIISALSRPLCAKSRATASAISALPEVCFTIDATALFAFLFRKHFFKDHC
jgi:hypothetical protein